MPTPLAERTVLAIAGGVLALVFATLVLPWGAPDEPQHYDYVAALVRLGRIPAREDISLASQQQSVWEPEHGC